MYAISFKGQTSEQRSRKRASNTTRKQKSHERHTEVEGSKLLENGENWEVYCRQQVLLHHHYHSFAEALGECKTWAICYVDLDLAMNDSVNINDLVDEEFEEIEDVDLESEGVILEEWMLAASKGPMFDSSEDV
ncbi:hypothetical protein Adt_32960 [Abeliophyllum distichum]|uniref:Uncharacterized protein n=1 Tax=Abeliophyllum distichum TaxID=126358 RepID=A0ABD1QYI2_9LAMI